MNNCAGELVGGACGNNMDHTVAILCNEKCSEKNKGVRGNKTVSVTSVPNSRQGHNIALPCHFLALCS